MEKMMFYKTFFAPFSKTHLMWVVCLCGAGLVAGGCGRTVFGSEEGICGDGILDSGEQCDDGNDSNTDACLNDCQWALCGDGYVWEGFEECDDGNTQPDDGCNPACRIEGGAWCGNGVLETGEECDDGNDANTDGCLNDCVVASCGDGYVWVGQEECDDGNTIPGDGCDDNCRFDTVECGNGVVEGQEQCDDGNISNNDACLNTCQWAVCGDGFVRFGVEDCDDANAVNSDACLDSCQAASCGDGYVWVGQEECDDDNNLPGDGCDPTCHLESADCGNGVLEEGEQCDDGNNANTDACLNTCQAAVCGDGFIWSGIEECDDGNTSNSDACVENCQAAVCGDGFLWAGVEQCDDGNTIPGDGCDDACRLDTVECGNGIVESGEECDDGNVSNNDECLNTCQVAFCGDGFVWSAVEECDDGNTANNDACLNSCRAAVCGDGIVWAGVEECDDGNTSNSDACLSDCLAASCGDWHVWAGVEECDDGNTAAGDGCDADCQLESATCGDGTVETGEECDDGNDSNEDACLNNCQNAECGDGFVWSGVEECDDGNTIDSDACVSGCVAASCGDGFVWAGQEACDDGNTVNTDACLDSCEAASCGDGFIWQGVEICDDGNNTSGDGCAGDCLSDESCGNGIVDSAAGEICDDGNNTSGDGCSADCVSDETCGNGYLDIVTGEECDDGNTVGGDGCDPFCRLELCEVDMDLGTLPVNVEVGRVLDMTVADDSEVSCGQGVDTVIAFEMGIDADLALEIAQLGDHAFGLYNDTEGLCTDSLISCYDPGGFPSGDTVFSNLSAGRYFLIVEAYTPDEEDTAWIWLTVLGDTPACGNGVEDPGEVCDDGNTVSGDGCSADCLSDEICGNGYLDVVLGEQCDDGNTVGGDGCAADCLSDESCGNGVQDPGEVCDDGNMRSGDGCSADCLSDETCGNGYLDAAAGEGCDDGNTSGGDGCDANCQVEPGVCYVDQNLGLLTPGIPVNQTLDVAVAGDEWVTGCVSSGPEVVLTFEMDRPGNIDLTFYQSGDHSIGLYTEGQVTEMCVAAGGVCLDNDPGEPGHVIFMGRPAGEYYLIAEGQSPDMAGQVDIYLFIQGCAPDQDLGMLPLNSDVSTAVNTSNGTQMFEAGCAGDSGRERVVAFQLSQEVDLTLSWTQSGDHVLALNEEGGGECDEHPVSCHDPAGQPTGSTVFQRVAAGAYLILIDAYDPGDEGDVDVTLHATP